MKYPIINRAVSIVILIVFSLAATVVICYDFITVKLDNNPLKRPLKIVWCVLWWFVALYAFFMLICVPFFRWWDGVVLFLNHVIWG